MTSSLISSLLHSRVTLNLEWCDEIKLSNLLLPRKGEELHDTVGKMKDAEHDKFTKSHKKSTRLPKP